MNNTILLSIAIPTYNRESFLDVSLNKITLQMTDEVEIVISDDGSKDNTEMVAKKWQEKFPNKIIYYKKPQNERFDKNLITVVEKASGKYCWFMSDDDMLNPEAVDRVLEEIKKAESKNNNTFIMLNYSRYDNNSKSVTIEKMIEFGDTNFSLEEFMSTPTNNSYFNYIGINIIYMSIFVFPRELWLKNVEDCKKFIGTNFIHCFIFLHILTKNPSIVINYISKPYILYRSGNIRDWGTNVWRDYHTKFLNEAISLKIALPTLFLMKIKYFSRSHLVMIGGKVKRIIKSIIKI